MPSFNLFGKGKGGGKASYRKLEQHSDEEDEFSLSDTDEKVIFSRPGEIELNLCPETKIHHGKSHEPSKRQYAALFFVIIVVGVSMLTVLVYYVKTHHSGSVNNSTVSTDQSKVRHPIVGHKTTSANSESTTTNLPPQEEAFSPDVKGWNIEFKNRVGEGGQRLFDCNEDGRDDIIFASGDSDMLTAAMTSSNVTSFDTARKDCESMNTTYPCLGYIYCLQGLNGVQLWTLKVRSEVFLLNCEDFDLDGDGKMDCIGTGRRATVVAFNPRTGKEIWRSEDDLFYNAGWNTYRVAALPDWDGDGVPEVLVANGGDVLKEPQDHNRAPGRLLVLSGKTGKPFGKRYLDMPNRRETYTSPVLYQPVSEGNTYVLFGSGGETVNGDLMGISLHDFCLYVLDVSENSACPQGASGDVFSTLQKDGNGIFVLYSGQQKGVLVPPLIVDVNNDGILDLVVHVFEGKVVLIDGSTATITWETEYIGMESYSTPAPGYFDDDDTLDFMVHWNTGAWMDYTDSNVSIINGKDGTLLWSLNSAAMQMSSPLTIATSEPHLHMFLFRQQGRESLYTWDKYGNLFYNGTQRIPKGVTKIGGRRRKRHGSEEHADDTGMPSGDTQMSPAEFKKMAFETRHLVCDDDLSSFRGEVLVISRYNPHEALRVLDLPSERHNYSAPAHCPLCSERDDDMDRGECLHSDWLGPPTEKNMPLNSEDLNNRFNDEGPGSNLPDEGFAPRAKRSQYSGSIMENNGAQAHNGQADGQRALTESRRAVAEGRAKLSTGRKGVKGATVEMCSTDSPDEMSTVMLGNLDGDENLDLVTVLSYHYPKLDGDYCRQGSNTRIVIRKVSLEANVLDNKAEKVRLKPETSMGKTSGTSPLANKQRIFLPLQQQQWTQYLGKKGQSLYNTP